MSKCSEANYMYCMTIYRKYLSIVLKLMSEVGLLGDL